MEDIKTPVDLGHDDVDGQECKDGRSRTWMILLYPDNPEHKKVLEETLPELDWNYAGRVHDKDPNTKEHHHVVVIFKDGRRNTDVAKDLGIDKRWLRAWDRQKKAFRYLCHKDNPEKFQYSPDAIYGTLAEKAMTQCSKGDQLSEAQSVKELLELLDSIDGFVSYKYFLKLVNEKGFFSVFRRMGVLAVKVLDEHNADIQRKLDEELRANLKKDNDRAEFSAFLKSIDHLPFEDRCRILQEQGFPALPLDE